MIKVELGKIHTTPTTFSDAVETILAMTKADSPALIVTPNIAHVWMAEEFAALREAYARADLAPPDGWPVVEAIRWLTSGNVDVERVAGSDLMMSLCERSISAALVGGRRDSAERASQTLLARNQELNIVATECVPRDELEDATARTALIERLASADADIIFIGLGAPRQEELALELVKSLRRGVVMCIGASIEFAAGTLQRAPRWVQRLNLEWLYRLLNEPRKLAGRYVRAAPYFVRVVLAERRKSRHAAVRSSVPQRESRLDYE